MIPVQTNMRDKVRGISFLMGKAKFNCACLFAVFVAFLAMAVSQIPASAQQGRENTGAETTQVSTQERVRAATFAYSAEISSDSENTLITVKFDGLPDYRVFFMENPDRMVLEVSGADFRLESHVSEDSEGVTNGWRSGRITSDKSRLVVSLARPATLVTSEVSKLEESDRHYLNLVLSEVSRDQFAGKIRKQQQLLGSSGESVVKGDRVRSGPRKDGHFTIVIDPGHGGIDGGASGKHTDIVEKDLVLDIAKLLGKHIEKAGPFDVLYTRDSDVFVSLSERQKFTRRSRADLLISLHADSLRQEYVRGATVYTLAKKASDALSSQLAESENLSDVVAGLAVPEAQDDVTDILADLTLRETTRFSRAFSALLVNQLKKDIILINNPNRSASFRVLKNAENPGVLIELGYLSNIEDEKTLVDPKWQEKVAVIIADSVREFFRGRRPLAQGN